MIPLQARPRQQRLAIAGLLIASLAAIPLVLCLGWVGVHMGQLSARDRLAQSVEDLRSSLRVAREARGTNPALVLLSDVENRAAYGSWDLGATRLQLQGEALATALEDVGATIESITAPSPARLGGVREVRLVMTARGAPERLLAALASQSRPDLRVFSMTLEALPDGTGEARLRLALVRTVAEEDSSAD